MHAVSKTTLGALVWLAIALLAWRAYEVTDPADRSRLTDTVEELRRFSREGPAWVRVEFPVEVELYEGDGVYLARDGELVRVGEIRAGSPDRTRHRAVVDPDVQPERLTRAVAITSSASLPWVYKTLLPAPTLDRIERQWIEFRDANARRFLAALAPIVKETAAAMVDLVREELDLALARRSDELTALAEQYGEELLVQTLLPMIVDEVWPIVQRHGAEPVEKIGRELWEEAPVFGLAWSGLYDHLPLTEGNKAEERWAAFLEDAAFPIVRKHQGEVRDALVAIVRDVAQNARIRRTMQESLMKLRDDSRLRALALGVGQDVVGSARIRGYLQSRLDEPKVAAIFDAMRSEFDDFNRELAKNIVFEADHHQISPHFVRFLRTMVLKKDWRWVMVSDQDPVFEAPDEAPVGSITRVGVDR